MGWSQQVHDSRTAASLDKARDEARQRRRKAPVPVKPDARPLPVLSIVAAAAGYLLWRRHGARLQAVRWEELPVVHQFLSLVADTTPSSGGVVKGTVGRSGKAGAVRQQATASAVAAAAHPPSSSKPSPAPSVPQGRPALAPSPSAQPSTSASTTAAAAGGGGKKKKGGKKRRK